MFVCLYVQVDTLVIILAHAYIVLTSDEANIGLLITPQAKPSSEKNGGLVLHSAEPQNKNRPSAGPSGIQFLYPPPGHDQPAQGRQYYRSLYCDGR